MWADMAEAIEHMFDCQPSGRAGASTSLAIHASFEYVSVPTMNRLIDLLSKCLVIAKRRHEAVPSMGTSVGLEGENRRETTAC